MAPIATDWFSFPVFIDDVIGSFLNFPHNLMVAALTDTIVAEITARGKAAVAVIRVSGPEAWAIGASIFSPWPDPVESHVASYGTFQHGDDGLILPFADGRGYTGDQSVEFMIHGGSASVRGLIGLCLDRGARMACPGEFSQRAFLNGRLDLSQAEGVRDIVDAETASQLKHATRMRDGIFARGIHEMRTRLLGVRAQIEASVDFSDEVGPLNKSAILRELSQTSEGIDLWLRTADFGRLLREGIRIAIVGPPNSGKSSLLNALMRSDRAIVSEIPGTTRDFIEEAVEIGGIKCVLIDTAGIRVAVDSIEAKGVERSHEMARNSDWVWHVYDGSIGLVSVIEFDQPVLRIANKADLPSFDADDLAISTLTRQGLDTLEELVSRFVPNTEEIMVNERHKTSLLKARSATEMAVEALGNDLPDDLIVVGLQAAEAALGEITGDTTSPDVLHELFSRFCVGK